ncbi:uncharacterized protein LOC135936535 [Cloeon dipterum]|uniref:uncharacterized protein LOC135936535 n=1 Tax=Cloeon dipterum TaxID=197152 RepID=UPI0032204BCE
MPECTPLEYKKLLVRHADPNNSKRKWDVHDYLKILGSKDNYNSAVKLIDDSDYVTTEVDDERHRDDDSVNQRPVRKVGKSSKYRDFVTDERNPESSGSEAVRKKKQRQAISESSDSSNQLSEDDDLGADDLEEIPEDESVVKVNTPIDSINSAEDSSAGYTTRSTKTVKITHQILKTPTKIPKVSSHLPKSDHSKISNDLEYIKGMISTHYELSLKTQDSLMELTKTISRLSMKNSWKPGEQPEESPNFETFRRGLPLKSMIEFEEFNEAIKEDRTLYNNMVSHLAEVVVNGSLTNAVNTMLRTLMMDAVGRLFNMSGADKNNKQKKIAFSQTSVAELAIDALLASGAKTEPNISRGNVVLKMRRWLQDAPTRYNRKLQTSEAKKSVITDDSDENTSVKSNQLEPENVGESSDGERETLTKRNEKRGSTNRVPFQTTRQISSTSFASSGSDGEMHKKGK